MATLPPEIVESLVAQGLIGDGVPVEAERLTGGVSSDIWKVVAGDRIFCVKRAMAQLAVKDEWLVPVERNRYEREWYQTVAARFPGAAPAVLGYDDDVLFVAMAWLDPDHYTLWKPELLAGRVDQAFAFAVGARLADIHAATAGDTGIAARFATDPLFEALRLEPYLRATGRRHPSLATRLDALADRTAATRRALVHGDVSPKNIMIGPDARPVFLDAECAWYGDPAFDLAFCLNHLLLKCIVAPAATSSLLAAFDGLRVAYMDRVDWEPDAALEARAASLLPGLLLARIDGKSPVEYITGDDDRDRVRQVAIPLIESAPTRLEAVRDAWGERMGV